MPHKLYPMTDKAKPKGRMDYYTPPRPPHCSGCCLYIPNPEDPGLNQWPWVVDVT